MELILVVLALMAVMLLVAGAGGISDQAWIEGGCLALLLIAGCVVFAVVMARID